MLLAATLYPRTPFLPLHPSLRVYIECEQSALSRRVLPRAKRTAPFPNLMTFGRAAPSPFVILEKTFPHLNGFMGALFMVQFSPLGYLAVKARQHPLPRPRIYGVLAKLEFLGATLTILLLTLTTPGPSPVVKYWWPF